MGLRTLLLLLLLNEIGLSWWARWSYCSARCSAGWRGFVPVARLAAEAFSGSTLVRSVGHIPLIQIL